MIGMQTTGTLRTYADLSPKKSPTIFSTPRSENLICSKKVTDAVGNVFVLHIEIQVKDEPDMVYRMADYFVMLHRQYRIPIRQYVIFIGAGQPVMSHQLREGPISFAFGLLALSSIDCRIFLASDQPEEILLSILAGFINQSAETVIREMVSRLGETTDGDFAFKKRINQLRVLAQLRKLRQLTNKIMDSIAEFFKEEENILFIRGEAKALRKLVPGLLKKSTLTVDQIAAVAGVSAGYVNNLKSGQDAPN